MSEEIIKAKPINTKSKCAQQLEEADKKFKEFSKNVEELTVEGKYFATGYC